MNYQGMAQRFISEHDMGEKWSPFDRMERIAIEIFAEWLDKQSEKRLKDHVRALRADEGLKALAKERNI